MSVPARFRVELEDCSIVGEHTMSSLHLLVCDFTPDDREIDRIMLQLAYDVLAYGIAALELDGQPFMRVALLSAPTATEVRS